MKNVYSNWAMENILRNVPWAILKEKIEEYEKCPSEELKIHILKTYQQHFPVSYPEFEKEFK